MDGGGGDVDNIINYNNNLRWGKPTLEAPHVLSLGNTNVHSFCWLPLALNVPGISIWKCDELHLCCYTFRP